MNNACGGKTNVRCVFSAEVRQEAVQQALAAYQNRPKPSLPMPSKRTSVMAKSPDRERHDSGAHLNPNFFTSNYFALPIPISSKRNFTSFYLMSKISVIWTNITSGQP